jgi:glycosyltransferase involved in cell wall biosynthesis
MSTRPIHVLYVVRPRDGGAVRHVFELAKGITARGTTVTLIGDPRIEYREEFDRIAMVIPMKFNRLPGVTDLLSILTMRRILRGGQFDIIHAHCAGAGFVARVANAVSGRALPVIYTPHYYSFDMKAFRGLSRAVFFWIEKALAAITDCTVCVSDFERASAERVRSRRMSVVMIPNGIHIDPLPGAEVARSAHPTVFFVGRLSHDKAPDVFLDAWAEIEKAGGHATAEMIGSGPLERQLRGRALKLGLTRLKFRGHVPGVARLLSPSDIVVIPSRHEALPYVLLEAMAAECTIVASRVGGIPEWILPGTNGLLTDPANPRALVDALTPVIQDADLRRRLGVEARATLLARGSLADMVDRHERLYGALA